MTDIPFIDMTDLRSSDAAARARVAKQVGDACRDVGFFVVTGHGVPASVIDGAFDAGRRFFALPPQAKRPLAIEVHGHNRGYVGLGVEALDENQPGDAKEAFNLIWSGDATRPSNVWPTLEGWREATQAYFDATLAAGRWLHVAFAIDLGLPENFFADKIDRPMATLRLLHYPARASQPQPDLQPQPPGRSDSDVGQGEPPTEPMVPSARSPLMTDDPADGASLPAASPALGAGAHTDYGNVTLLATDGVAGLQVRRRGGGWIDAPAVPGAFICNIGDCLMRWTNDVYVSTPHRVLQPVAERYSIALFVDPNPDACVAAIPSCIPAGTQPKYAPISAADYLQSRFDSTYATTGRSEQNVES